MAIQPFYGEQYLHVAMSVYIVEESYRPMLSIAILWGTSWLLLQAWQSWAGPSAQSASFTMVELELH